MCMIDVIHDVNIDMHQEQMALGSLKHSGSVMSSMSSWPMDTLVI